MYASPEDQPAPAVCGDAFIQNEIPALGAFKRNLSAIASQIHHSTHSPRVIHQYQIWASLFSYAQEIISMNGMKRNARSQ
ncbi:hypothetical protein MKMG_00143 [Methanogenium sp. MK-MG]|nr:hypothetical protein MKMG_00143 [Methanogenium sp. MK-MG]